jgi:hypothetical protein
MNAFLPAKVLEVLMLLKSRNTPRELTMMVVPHYDSPVRTIRIPMSVVYGLVVLMIFGVSMLGYYIKDYSQKESRIETLRQGSNRRLVDAQREDLHILNNKLTQIQNQYSYVMSFMEYASGIDRDVRKSIGIASSNQSWETILKENNLEYKADPKPASTCMPESWTTVVKAGDSIKNDQKEWAINLQQLKLNSEECKNILEHTPSGWPAKGRHSSPWGYRDWTNSFHHGVDICNVTGTPLHATASGKVVRSESYVGYGNCVDIDHGGGIITRYGHCDKLLVKVGETVKVGQVVATMGNTGNSLTPHIHYEIRINDESVDPEKFPF